MAIREILDETALPFDREGARPFYEWIRHKIDPTVLIACDSGECFTRRDGARWEHPAYSVEKSRATDKWGDVRPRSAWYDSAIYSPSAKRDAA